MTGAIIIAILIGAIALVLNWFYAHVLDVPPRTEYDARLAAGEKGKKRV